MRPMPLCGSAGYYCSCAETVFADNVLVAIGTGGGTIFVENMPLCIYGSGATDVFVGS